MPCLHVFCTSPRACVEVHGCPMRPANSRYIHREYRYVDCGAMGPSESRDQIGSNQIISDLCYSLGHQGSLKFRTPPIQLPERQGERREDKKGLGIEKRKSEAGIGRHSCRSDGSYGWHTLMQFWVGACAFLNNGVWKVLQSVTKLFQVFLIEATCSHPAWTLGRILWSS